MKKQKKTTTAEVSKSDKAEVNQDVFTQDVLRSEVT